MSSMRAAGPPPRLRRSCLTVPGSSTKMLARARTLGADMVLVDLEDAVAPHEKTDGTRAQVAEALAEPGWTAPTRAVRVNGMTTAWWERDVAVVVAAAGNGLDCIVVPKVERAAGVRESRSRPSCGIVSIRTRGVNQRGEVVIELTRSFMVFKSDAPEVSDVFPVTDEPWRVGG